MYIIAHTCNPCSNWKHNSSWQPKLCDEHGRSCSSIYWTQMACLLSLCQLPGNSALTSSWNQQNHIKVALVPPSFLDRNRLTHLQPSGYRTRCSHLRKNQQATDWQWRGACGVLCLPPLYQKKFFWWGLVLSKGLTEWRKKPIRLGVWMCIPRSDIGMLARGGVPAEPPIILCEAFRAFPGK
jgi:hypothetical protein